MSEREPHRRPEFDSLVQGWGSDSFEDLSARIELAAEWTLANKPLKPAEEKIVTAMIARQVQLGVEHGDFEDCGIGRDFKLGDLEGH